MKNQTKLQLLLIVLVLISNTTSAAPLLGPVYCLAKSLRIALASIGTGLVVLMIVYAGLRYVYSADDPGGRKQAQSIIVNAIIAGVLISIAYAVIYGGVLGSMVETLAGSGVYSQYQSLSCT